MRCSAPMPNRYLRCHSLPPGSGCSCHTRHRGPCRRYRARRVRTVPPVRCRPALRGTRYHPGGRTRSAPAVPGCRWLGPLQSHVGGKLGVVGHVITRRVGTDTVGVDLTVHRANRVQAQVVGDAQAALSSKPCRVTSSMFSTVRSRSRDYEEFEELHVIDFGVERRSFRFSRLLNRELRKPTSKALEASLSISRGATSAAPWFNRIAAPSRHFRGCCASVLAHAPATEQAVLSVISQVRLTLGPLEKVALRLPMSP